MGYILVLVPGTVQGLGPGEAPASSDPWQLWERGWLSQSAQQMVGQSSGKAPNLNTGLSLSIWEITRLVSVMLVDTPDVIGDSVRHLACQQTAQTGNHPSTQSSICTNQS